MLGSLFLHLLEPVRGGFSRALYQNTKTIGILEHNSPLTKMKSSWTSELDAFKSKIIGYLVNVVHDKRNMNTIRITRACTDF